MHIRWNNGGCVLLVVAALLTSNGCKDAGYKMAPVSGFVMLNGAPLPNATVVFEPVAEEGKEESGPASSGRTDLSGKFELKAGDGTVGAVIGKHRVRIWPEDTAGGTGEGDSVDNDPQAEESETTAEEGDEYAGEEEESDVMDYSEEPEDAIPDRYNVQTTLTETVPEAGTDTVRFDLTR